MSSLTKQIATGACPTCRTALEVTVISHFNVRKTRRNDDDASKESDEPAKKRPKHPKEQKKPSKPKPKSPSQKKNKADKAKPKKPSKKKEEDKSSVAEPKVMAPPTAESLALAKRTVDWLRKQSGGQEPQLLMNDSYAVVAPDPSGITEGSKGASRTVYVLARMFPVEQTQQRFDALNQLEFMPAGTIKKRAGGAFDREKCCFTERYADGSFPYYGHYTGTTPMHKHFNTPLTDIDAPVVKRMRDEHMEAEVNNHIIVTRYANGNFGMPMHDDKDDDMVAEPHVWIKSFGATRTLRFVHKRQTDQVVELKMTEGSVFVMGPQTNANWKHEVPLEPTVTEPRISVIFRTIANKKKASKIACACVRCKQAKEARRANASASA